MAQCMEPIEKITDLGVSVQEARVSQVRLNDTLRYPVSTTNKSTQVVPEDNFLSGRLSGDVELRNVSFGFNTMDPPVITDISLSAGRGQMVAIVGPSGSGKSTLAKVIAGLYKPLSGEILLDGIPLDRVPQDVITRSITFVDQDIALFQGTIRDNLCMWDASIPMEWIAESSYDACIDEFIAECGGGYDFVLDEDARNLSGGQRQRIEIARSLSNRPSILILDEATSSLDAHVEEMIMHRLRRRGITCLVMAHRLSTVKQCDDIIVLHHGKVVERGTHESMMKGKGPYAKLVASE
jgi:ABC-type bacteriocin/lantibiotic exporter with double-glycine peptidase domain